MLDSYSVALGFGLGVWFVLLAYVWAQEIATWRKRRRDAYRRFFIEAAAEEARRDLLRLRP